MFANVSDDQVHASKCSGWMTSSLAGTTGQNAPTCHHDTKRVPLRYSPRGPQIALFRLAKSTAAYNGHSGAVLKFIKA